MDRSTLAIDGQGRQARTVGSLLLLSPLLAFIALATVFRPFAFESAYDQARAFQLAVLAASSAIFTFVGISRFDRGARVVTIAPRALFGLAFFTLLAMSSAVLAAHPFWAFEELALTYLLVIAVLAVAASFNRESAAIFDAAFVLAFVASVVLFTFVFVVAQVAAHEAGARFQWFTPFVTFANVRFFSQYQAYTLPLLVLPLLAFKVPQRWRIGAFVIGAIWWALQIAVGTRAVWFGLFVELLFILWFLRNEAKRFLGVQAAQIAGGTVAYWLFIKLVQQAPPGIEHIVDEGLNSSSRLPLWQSALQMIAEAPLLGVGPMHYSFRQMTIASHPHNTLLQVASEYGIIGLLLAAFAFLLLLRWAVKTCRSTSGANREINVALVACLVMGLSDAMFSGNTLMPHSQMALCVIVGWLLGRNRVLDGNVEATRTSNTLNWRKWVLLLTSVLSLVVLGAGSVDYFSHTQDGATSDEILHPRMWQNGHWPVK
jgi:putative inorganic carbon (HCO3(-)) transporter